MATHRKREDNGAEEAGATPSKAEADELALAEELLQPPSPEEKP